MNNALKVDLIKCVDFVQRKMNKQGTPSYKLIEGEPLPYYRGPNGCKCPAGHLIPDSEYDVSFEHNSADEVVKLSWINDIVGTNFKKNQRKVVFEMLNKIQRAHDDALDKWWEARQFKQPIKPDCMAILNFKLSAISWD